jgi:hypothetical protein
LVVVEVALVAWVPLVETVVLEAAAVAVVARTSQAIQEALALLAKVIMVDTVGRPAVGMVDRLVVVEVALDRLE